MTHDFDIEPTTPLSKAIETFAAHKPEKLSPRSWAAYLSSLRALHRQIPGDPVVGWLPAEAVTTAFAKMEAIYKTARYAQARAAWRLLREWALRNRVSLPPGPERQRRGPEPVVYLPPVSVGVALVELLRLVPDRALTHRAVTALRWETFRAENFQGRQALMIPSSGSYVVVPPEGMGHVRVLWDYARGEEDRPLVPFLPASPGSVEPMSLDTLRKLLRGAKARLTAPPTPKRTTDPGSLDGVAAVIQAPHTAEDAGDGVSEVHGEGVGSGAGTGNPTNGAGGGAAGSG